jgi:hypothetical protein
LGGLSLGLVEPGDAAAVGRLGLGGLLPAQPGDLLHQRHVNQNSPPRHVPACGDEADQATQPSKPTKAQKDERGGGQRTEEDEGEDEGDGEEGAEEEDDGELQRRRQTSRHGTGGSSIPGVWGKRSVTGSESMSPQTRGPASYEVGYGWFTRCFTL